MMRKWTYFSKMTVSRAESDDGIWVRNFSKVNNFAEEELWRLTRGGETTFQLARSANRPPQRMTSFFYSSRAARPFTECLSLFPEKDITAYIYQNRNYMLLYTFTAAESSNLRYCNNFAEEEEYQCTKTRRRHVKCFPLCTIV